jgi:hypothetical protein
MSPNNTFALYTNAEGLFSKRDEFTTLVDSIKPGIVCVSETHLKPGDTNDFWSPRNYTTFRADRVNRAKGGVLICIDDTLSPRNETAVTSNTGDWESVWCHITLGGDHYLVGCCYRSPDITIESHGRFINSLRRQFDSRGGMKMLVTGDFNYPDIVWPDAVGNPLSSSKEDTFLTALDDNFLSQHVNFLTRFRGIQRPSLLDLLITTPDVVIDDMAPCAPLGRSDHVVITWSLPHCTRRKADKEIICYRDADYDLLDDIIANIDWDNEFSDASCEEAWEVLRDLLNDLVFNFIPKKTPPRAHRPLWMTSKLKNLINVKKRKWKSYQETRTEANWLFYTEARNRVSNNIRVAKTNLERDIAFKSKTNKKVLYNYFSSSKPTKCTFSIKDSQGSIITEDRGVAQSFNSFFSSVFLPKDANADLPQHGDDTPSLTTADFDEAAVFRQLSNLNPNKSAGRDGVHSAILHGCAKSLAKPLSIIFNLSFTTGVVPRDWRTAVVVPIHKKGSRTSVENYRPISLTSQVVKVFERLIHNTIFEFLTRNECLSRKQHGFRKAFSCTSNLLETLDYWTEACEEGAPCDAVFLDVKKAFDTVDHAVLLRKVDTLGIRGNFHTWIKKYLDCRTQCVSINGTLSDWSPVTSGVPQGSVLGPMLFLIFINDIPECVRSFCNLFADDLKICRKIRTPADARVLQEDLNNVLAWATANKMTFSEDKCEVLHIGYNNVSHNYTMNHKVLPTVKQVKTLGVVVTDNLKASVQCVAAAKKANSVLGQIRKHFSFLNLDTMRILYTVFVRPHLEFAIQAWNPYLARDICILESVQRRATRLLPELRSLDYEVRLRRLGLTTLAERRLRGDLLLTYRILHGLEGADFTHFFRAAPACGTRGHAMKLQTDYARLDVRKNFFARRVVKHWNCLPPAVVTAPSCNSWKARYDSR